MKSARSRLALTYALTMTLLILAYSSSLYYLYRQDVFADLDKRLRNDFETAEMRLENNTDLLSNVDSANWLTEIWSKEGKRIFSSGASETQPLGELSPECIRRDSSQFGMVLKENLNVRILCRPSEGAPEKYIIRVARLTETASKQLSRFLFLMLIGAPTIVLLAGLAGYFLARKALLPIKKITEKARVISAERLTERLPIENPHDELGLLAKTFNDTFERLEKSFSQMRRFTADASHELRTPLSAIRTMGEVALRQDSNSHRDTISGILEETARLQSLCESLLLLSKADAGSVVFNFQKLALENLVTDVVQLMEVLAEEKQQSIVLNLQPGLSVKGDTHFLRQAVLNLIDNAIKYSPPKSQIRISGFLQSGEVSLSVHDNGPGIEPKHQKKIFDRFYRIQNGRARSDGGAGLGLAICEWIVVAHQGRIQVKSEPGNGTEFKLFFPT